jgi:branched-chain amino acid transport system ATP-binding protein
MSGMEHTILKVDNISMIFGGLVAVSNFSCNLEKGELLGLIGPNGAGKTTVFNMLTGIYPPSKGQILFQDRSGTYHDVGKMRPYQLNHIGIARTFQNIRLFQRLTVEENVEIALHQSRTQGPIDFLFRTKRYRADEARMKNRTEEILSIFNIANKRYEQAKNLPYGEQRKLEIVRALAANPTLLLLDEPAAGMNPQETVDLMKLITFIRKEFDLTVLLIEHDMRLVMGICERILVLDYGKIIAQGLPEEIQKNPDVIKAYLGSDAEGAAEDEEANNG